MTATPMLRGLDDGARAALAGASRRSEQPAGATLYRDGDHSESVFVVERGAVELRAVRRGDGAASVVRVARAGDSFGEEALLPGLSRRLTATVVEPAAVMEIPIAVFQRVTGRAIDGTADREQRYLERAAARDLLACSAFARELGDADLEILLDGAQLERIARSTRIYEPGAPADRLYFVVEGLVQLQRESGATPAVTAYLARGDFFGDQEALAGAPRGAAAVAAGDTWIASVSKDVLRTLSDRNPGLLPRLRRVAESQEAAQSAVIGDAASRSTQHVFHDLYRMQMARSLLVIDQDSCVRCGHCAWSCEQVHGTSRLVRRGDKIVTQLEATGTATLLLPNTCQHCRHAACMIDCPTGAIGRDPEGEVFIRPSLCTGCGNCAKACPWENIQMAPRETGTSRLVQIGKKRAQVSHEPGLSTEIAVKCDLCRGFAAPACVEACPTGAVLRLDPSRDVAEVARVLRAPIESAGTAQRASVFGPIARAAGVAVAIAATAGAWALHRAHGWVPGRGIGLAAGIAAAVLVIALAAYVIPKRMVRARMRRRDAASRLVVEQRPPPRSRTRAHFIAHLALGGLLPAAALAHAGTQLRATPGGALAASLIVTVVLGVLAAIAYRAVPRALTRLERRGTLPEDLAGERDALDARLYRALSGKNDRIKAIADHVLVPYARSRFGALVLVASGRGLAAEARHVRAGIDRTLAGRTIDTTGLDELVAIAVELRALPARRALSWLVRVWPPLHVVASVSTIALLAVHVVFAVVLR